jgi:hypothetical protein
MNKLIKKFVEEAQFELILGGYLGYENNLERFAELIRQDERQSLGVKVRANEFIAAASKAPDAIGRPFMWAEFPTRGNDE